MLTLESLISTKDLVAVLADKGVSLRTVGSTPLDEAMKATKTYGQKLDSLADIDLLPADVYQMNEVRLEGGVPVDDIHTAYMDAASKVLGIQLAGHIAHATTVVLPLISELHNTIKSVQDFDERCGIRSYKVEMVNGSPLLDAPDFVAQVEKFSDIDPPRELPLVLDFKPLSDEQIVELMKIGAPSYDDAVGMFVSQCGMTLVRETFDVVFAGDRGAYRHYDMLRADREKSMARNFIVFLITTKLLANLNELPEVTGLAGMSSAKYGPALRGLQEVSGVSLYSQLSLQRRMEKSGKLIDKVDRKVVYVNKSVYDRFMADGGDIETILGAVVSGKKSDYVADLVNNVDLYKQAWTYHVTQAKMNAQTGELIDVRRTIDNFVRRYVQTSTDEVVVNNRDNILNNLQGYIETIYAPALKDVDMLAMRVVTEVMFNHTDAGAILCGVNEAMSANPEISKEDALNLSVTNYVADWFASQIELDK